VIEERLLIALRERANDRGVVTVRADILAKQVEASQEEVGTALGKLQRAGMVTILAPAPFVVLKLALWPNSGEKVGDSSPAYSYSQLSSDHVNESYKRDDALLREILDTLGESDPQSFHGAIANFAPAVIRKALERVRKAKSLRKNRTALFRYLLTKLS